MKKLKILVATLLLFAFAIPVFANAEETVTRSEAKVYIFKGETCGYCAKALEFFESIEEEYGKYFELVEYEVWNDAANAELMDKVAEYLGTEISGVPFIIIGDNTYPGFDETWGDEIKEKIISEYNKAEDERIDIVKEAQKEVDYDNLVTTISVIAIIGIVAFVYFARKDVNEESVNVSESRKENAVEKEENVKKIKTEIKEKKTTSKKSTNSKKTVENKKEKKDTTAKKKTTSTNKNKKN